MLELWYVVWVLLGASGEPVISPQFMSGPWPSDAECRQAGADMDYPTDAQVLRLRAAPGVYVVQMGCIQIDLDTPPVDHSKDQTT